VPEIRALWDEAFIFRALPHIFGAKSIQPPPKNGPYAYVHIASLRVDFDVFKLIGNESVPIQLAQCRFPGLAVSNKIYASNFIKQHSEAVTV